MIQIHLGRKPKLKEFQAPPKQLPRHVLHQGQLRHLWASRVRLKLPELAEHGGMIPVFASIGDKGLKGWRRLWFMISETRQGRKWLNILAWRSREPTVRSCEDKGRLFWRSQDHQKCVEERWRHGMESAREGLCAEGSRAGRLWRGVAGFSMTVPCCLWDLPFRNMIFTLCHFILKICNLFFTYIGVHGEQTLDFESVGIFKDHEDV